MASGEIVQASAETDPDLFWAIRGGGGNFGGVTAFEATPTTECFLVVEHFPGAVTRVDVTATAGESAVGGPSEGFEQCPGAPDGASPTRFVEE